MTNLAQLDEVVHRRTRRAVPQPLINLSRVGALLRLWDPVKGRSREDNS
jgi:hypothetical protein